jgi:hypothetical protein
MMPHMKSLPTGSHSRTLGLLLLLLVGLSLAPVSEAGERSRRAWPAFADYNSEPRKPDGRVDTDLLVARLTKLGVNAYYWLIWHAATDWEDLKAFLPKAAQAGIEVWVYLVPPSESPPMYGTLYSEPFRLDYARWAEELAKLSLRHANLTGWVIDDFYGNHELFTPAYVKDLRDRGRRLNPRLAFLPLMYFNEINRAFVEQYKDSIDGVVAAYPQSREEIENAWAILNDAAIALPGELSHPWYTPSKPGDFMRVSQSAVVRPGARCELRFRERDDFSGPTDGYHFKRVRVNGDIVWEQDAAGGTNAWRDVAVDVTEAVKGRASAAIAFELFDKQGVSNFGVRWFIKDLKAEGLVLEAALDRPWQWRVEKRGAFEAGFGDQVRKPARRFHVPFVVMTAGSAAEFRLRHGEPATPERMAEWLEMSLQSWRDGKCDGVVTYCLDTEAGSRTFDLARNAFRRYK